MSKPNETGKGGPTTRQVELFDRLTTDRDFGNANVGEMREQFAKQSIASASKWIDKAMALPRLAGADDSGANDEPTF